MEVTNYDRPHCTERPRVVTTARTTVTTAHQTLASRLYSSEKTRADRSAASPVKVVAACKSPLQ